MKTSACIAMLAAQIAFAQPGTIKGRVYGGGDGGPLPGVNVMVEGSLRGASTNTAGEFLIPDVPEGAHTVIFSLIGYRREVRPAVRVPAGDTVDVAVELHASAIQAEPIVVTASGRAQAAQEAPASVSVMDAAEISFRNTVTVDDALRYVPGVNMTQFQVNVRGSSGYSYGVGSRVLFLVDGIPLLTGDTGEINFESVPIGQVDRIEVLKGASSALYGAGALGGVINVITKPIADSLETDVRTYGGVYGNPSFYQWNWGGGTRLFGGVSVSHSRKIGPLGVVVYGSRVTDNGYRENDYKRRYNGGLKMSYEFSPSDALTATVNFLGQDRGSFLWWEDLSHALVPAGSQAGQTVQSQRFYTNASYRHTVSGNFLYALTALWYRNRFNDNVGASGETSLSNVLRAELRTTWLAGESHIVTSGIEGNLDRVNATLFGIHNGQGAGVYVQDEIALTGALRATLGARYDVQGIDSTSTNRQFSPRAALVYTPVEGTSFRASVGRGFRSPSVAELFTSTQAGGLQVVPNTALSPERSTSYEVGGSHLFGDLAIMDVALFQADYSDLIEAGFTAAGKAEFDNVTRARIRGMETSTSLGLFGRTCLLTLDYTYVFPRDVTTGDVLKYRPRHLFSASGTVRTGAFSAGVDYRYLSRVERIDEEFVALISDGDQRVPIVVTDVRLGFDFTRLGLPVSAIVNVNNLFQYNYVELIGNLAAPRSVVLTLDARI